MCFGSKQKEPETPAAAPAPPLQAPDAPLIGKSRIEETRDQYGADSPNYRVKRPSKMPAANPGGPITM
jgi:hypothetical protein